MHNIKHILLKEQNHFYHKIINFILLIIIIILTWQQIDYQGINNQGWEVLNNIINGFIHPQWQYLFTSGANSFLDLLLQTLAISFIGTILGSIIAFILSLLASQFFNLFINNIVLVIISIIKTIPILVYAIIFIKLFGPGSFCGIMTITFSVIGFLTKLFIVNINTINQQLIMLATSWGFNKWEIIYYIVINAKLSNFISNIIYTIDLNIKNSIVLGLVGAGGIGSALKFSVEANNWSKFAIIMIALIIIICSLDFISTKLRKELS